MKNPLLDFDFLKQLDLNNNKTTYARITSLTNDLYPIERIEGIVTAGSINIDGTSAVRRICNLTLTTSKLNIHNIYWGLSTRIKVEIGLENNIIKSTQTYRQEKINKVKNLLEKKNNATKEDVLKEISNNSHIIDYTKIYPNIIWFPQGIFILNSFKTSSQTNKYQITLTGKDKMCLLNGDVNGSFNAETQLDSEDVQQQDGTWVKEKRSIAYIIREMVHYYAQENFHNIIIKDIDILSLKAMRNYKTTFYLIKDISTGQIPEIFFSDASTDNHSNYKYYNYPDINVDFNQILNDFIFDIATDEDDIGLLSIDERAFSPSIIYDDNDNKYTVIKVENGEDLGYQLTETYYPEELIAGVGETVTSILDKIVKTFGDFEYFYNLDGQFVFQAKDIYLNPSRSSNKKDNYIEPEMLSSRVKYSFDSSKLTTAYQNTPNIGNIKNDFTIWGINKTSSGLEIPIHMRYAIDQKPEFYKNFDGQVFVTKDFIKYHYSKDTEMAKGIADIFPISKGNINIDYIIVDWREIIYQMQLDYYKHNHDDDFEVKIQQNNRDDILNLEYYKTGKTGYEQYYADIQGFWRTVYAPQEYVDTYTPSFRTDNVVDRANFYNGDIFIGPWNRQITEDPSGLLFWFDFFEANSPGLGQFSVPAIGSRSMNKSNDKVRALTYKDIPDIIFISLEEKEKYENAGRLLDGYNYIVIDDPEYPRYKFIEDCLANDKITLSTRGLTALEQIDNLLYTHAYCHETVNITTVPIFYLEPNTIISAEDEQKTVSGYYIINKMTLPLDYKGTMKITAIKVPERIY